jgi:hypothetical protein
MSLQSTSSIVTSLHVKNPLQVVESARVLRPAALFPNAATTALGCNESHERKRGFSVALINCFVYGFFLRSSSR